MQYTKHFYKMAAVSIAIMILGLIAGIIFGGLNLGVDFTGGTLVTIDIGTPDYDMNVVTDALEKNGVIGAQAMRTGTTTSVQSLADIRMPNLDDDTTESAQRAAVLEAIRETYPAAQITAVDRVEGVASGDLIRNAFLSVLVASVLILAYIWVRFEFLSGVTTVITLLHDVAIMVSFTCMLQIPVNSPFIAVVLTIVGYSINNTIVIFDRIRENSKHEAHVDKHRIAIVNTSIQGTLTRSINTSLTTLFTITMVYILGVESIRQFALPLIIGLVAGTYSSVFLAAPLWAIWHSALSEKAKKNAHAGKKGTTAKKPKLKSK